jgi:lipase chaperone LimK
MNHQTMYYFVGLLLSVCLVSVVWIFKPSTVLARSETIVTRPTPVSAAWEHSGQSMLAQQPARPPFVTGVEQLPASLQGTEVNGELAVDTWGNLIVSHAVRQLFDYFLSADGEEDQAMLVQRIRAYVQALQTIPAVVGDPLKELAQVRQQKQQVADLRAQHFDPLTSEAFFGAEDAYDQYTLARLDVLNDPQLSPTEKAKRIGAIMATLAPQMQDDLKAINQYQDLTALTSEWKAQSGSAQALRQLRESVVGVAATDRLETLDQEVAAWDQRVNGYLAQRDALQKQTSLAKTDQQHAIEQLKQRLFSAQEQVRIDALERIHDQGLQVNVHS